MPCLISSFPRAMKMLMKKKMLHETHRGREKLSPSSAKVDEWHANFFLLASARNDSQWRRQGQDARNKSRKEKRKPKEALGLVTNSIMQIGGDQFSK